MSRPNNPLEELERVFNRMSQQFEGEFSPLPEKGTSMAVDVEDREDEFVVTADVPGYTQDDLNVQIVGESLTISAQRMESTQTGEEGRYIRNERRQEQMSRSVTLPEPIVQDDVDATYTNGVLTVTLPKATGTESAHRIDIE